MTRLTVCLLALMLLAVLTLPQPAAAFSLRHPEKTGMALTVGSSYDPQPTFRFAQLSLMALYDYEDIMPHRAPEALRFKLEGSAGLADDSRMRLLASGNFFALYYLRGLARGAFRPYVEAGAGLVYSDFQVDGQGLRLNFNPQAGIGAEWQTADRRSWYGALCAYHISNGNLHHDNRGINAVSMQLGVLF